MSIKGFSVGGNVERYDYNSLDNLPSEITIDPALSGSSTNPVQNKVVTGAINATTDSVNALSGEVSGLKSAFEIETRTSKNLLNLLTVTNSANLDGSGNVVENTSKTVTEFIKAIPGKYIVYSYFYYGTQRAGIIQRICYYDSHGSFLSYVNGNSSPIPANAVYFRCALQGTPLEETSVNTKFMLEMADTTTFTEYQAYFPTTNAYTLKESSLPESVEERFSLLEDKADDITDKINLTIAESAYVKRIDIGHSMAWSNGYVDKNGTPQANDGYRYTAKIEVKKDDILTSSSSFRFIAVFDESDNAIPDLFTQNTSSFVVPESVAKVIISVAVGNYQKAGIIIKESAETETRPYTRGRIDIFTTDSQKTILDKLIYAYEHKNFDVYWETGSYTFDTIFDTMYHDYGYTIGIEMPIGGNCRYYFNGSTITGIQTSVDEQVVDNSSLFGSRRHTGSYELYDGILIGNDLIYIVHDEAAGEAEPYKRVYHNMRMFYNTTSQASALRKCIGGGAGQHGIIDISDCVFVGDNVQEVSYHGNNTSGITCHIDLLCTGCWFMHKLQLNQMYSNGTGTALISNCSSGEAINVDNSWNVYMMNNVVR